MQPAGRIDTIMDLRKVKEWWFNVPLLVFQLAFMIAGTILGKIKWPKPLPIIRVLCVIAMIVNIAGMITSVMEGNWYSFSFFVVAFIYFILQYRGIDWCKVWQAAKVSHVRLVLEPAITLDGVSDQYFWVMNFGYKYAEIQIWDIDWNSGKRFKYYEAMFPTPPEFMEPVIQYAHDQEGKRYDEVQLFSYFPHLIAWTIYPPCWGKELKIIKALNRPGGLEDCISGFVACVRWPERDFVKEYRARIVATIERVKPAKPDTRFFPGYSTAVIPPALAPLSKNWIIKEREEK